MHNPNQEKNENQKLTSFSGIYSIRFQKETSSDITLSK